MGNLRGYACRYAHVLTDGRDSVDWIVRVFSKEKRGAISENLSPILDLLSMASEQWLATSNIVGLVEHVKSACQRRTLGFIAFIFFWNFQILFGYTLTEVFFYLQFTYLS